MIPSLLPFNFNAVAIDLILKLILSPNMMLFIRKMSKVEFTKVRTLPSCVFDRQLSNKKLLEEKTEIVELGD